MVICWRHSLRRLHSRSPAPLAGRAVKGDDHMALCRPSCRCVRSSDTLHAVVSFPLPLVCCEPPTCCTSRQHWQSIPPPRFQSVHGGEAKTSLSSPAPSAHGPPPPATTTPPISAAAAGRSSSPDCVVCLWFREAPARYGTAAVHSRGSQSGHGCAAPLSLLESSVASARLAGASRSAGVPCRPTMQQFRSSLCSIDHCILVLLSSTDQEHKRQPRMSYLLPHLHSGFAVDQAILSVSAVRQMSRGPRGAYTAGKRVPITSLRCRRRTVSSSSALGTTMTTRACRWTRFWPPPRTPSKRSP